jgi:hypothetical protein
MDNRQIRAMLAVMNFTAGFTQEWAAEVVKVGDSAFTMGAVKEIRFWLVEEGTELWKNKELIWA